MYPLLWYPECGAGEALLSLGFFPERIGFFFEELKLVGSTWMTPGVMLCGGDDGGVERSAGFWA